ncbi:hypothetical protein Ahy_B01g053765 isoform L [Arachis hypogaea]|uniref:Uncharacterized protein n=1 Tax=Arachis hypogaea TaxID=3818 RepID=A0A445ASI3_ARAHY|nr:hypothetical protein Ahy_B01g053765 isoform L [Arachis hypogaea]
MVSSISKPPCVSAPRLEQTFSASTSISPSPLACSSMSAQGKLHVASNVTKHKNMMLSVSYSSGFNLLLHSRSH